MAMTPEGKVKERIKKILKAAPSCYYHMPVQNGMGAPSLDFVGCSWGRYFAIEAKAPGKAPTERQMLTVDDIKAAAGKVFVIDGDENDYRSLELWLSLP